MADIAGPYSSLKILHHPERIAALKRGEQIVPTQIQMTLSATCNASCSFCAYRLDGYSSNQLFTLGSELSAYGHNNPKRIMPYEKAIEVLDDCAEMGVRAIQMTGSGEPTVHPRHIEIFNAVIDRGMDLSLVSNGMIFRDGLIPVLLKAKWVRFSFDAGNKETYSQIRVTSLDTMDRVLANVKKLADERNKLRDSGGDCELVIGTGFVVTRENWKEVPILAKKVKEIGVDNLRISAVFQSDGAEYFKDFHSEAAEVCKEAESYGDDKFRVFNNFGLRIDDLYAKNPDYSFCGYQQFTSYVADDLTVYRCCVYSFNERGIVGSIKNQRFKELWESDQKKQNFNEFDARGCERCLYNSTNKTILYAIDPNPMHANFV